MEENIVRSCVSGMRSPAGLPARPRRAPPAPGYDHAPTAASTPRRTANRSTSRRRSTHSIRTHSPYRSPSKSNRCASRRPPAVREGRLGALVHHPLGAAAPPLDPDRVDAVGRQQLLGRHVGQVDRRHAEQPAAPLAVPHPPAHLVRPAEHPGRGGQVAAGDRAPDPRAGDVLLADIHRPRPRPRRTRARRPAAGASRRRRSGRGRTRDRARSPARASGSARAARARTNSSGVNAARRRSNRRNST